MDESRQQPQTHRRGKSEMGKLQIHFITSVRREKEEYHGDYRFPCLFHVLSRLSVSVCQCVCVSASLTVRSRSFGRTATDDCGNAAAGDAASSPPFAAPAAAAVASLSNALSHTLAS